MSPQKKLMLRRNALFRQQLSTTESYCIYAHSQPLLNCAQPALEMQHETAELNGAATSSLLRHQPSADR
jgi:hypothetical protein